MKGLLTTLLVVISITAIYTLTIDTYAENSGTLGTNYFCACTTVNNTCYTGTGVAIGGHRAQILVPYLNAQGVPWQLGCDGLQDYDYNTYCNSGLESQTGCPTTGCTGNYGTGGQLSYSTVAGSASNLYNIWDGGCGATTFNNINKVGLGGVDLTDGGISDSFNINIGKVDLGSTLNVFIWSDASHGSFATFDPSSFSRNANLGGAYTRASLGFVNDFIQLNGTSGPADFRNVGAIALEIIGTDALDLIIALIETAGVLNLQKSANLTTDSVPAGIAGPGDVVTFNLSLSYNGLGNPVQNVYLWDDPSRDFKVAPNTAYFPYYSLVPGSLIVTTSDIDPVSGALTAANYPYTEVNGPNVQANLGRVVIYLGNVTEYTYYNVFFAVRIPNSLPCCLPTCRAQCNSGTGGESCYCIANTAYYCENTDGINLNITYSNGTRPNFNSAFVDANCGYSTVPSTGPVGVGASTTPQITVTPVYAPSSPYVAFTTPAPPSSVAPGAQVCATFVVGNNGTRDTAAVATLTFNPTLLTTSTTGSSTQFTCSGSSCTSALIQYAAGSSVTYTLCFTANQLSTCTTTQSIFSAAITPNGCNSTTITGPISNGNGTEIDGSVPVGACLDVSSADNTATSSPTNIAGQAILSLNSNFSSTTVGPQGTSILSICYSNSGNSPATTSVVRITLPSGVSASGTSWTVSGTTATYTVGTIASGTVCSPLPALTITYTASTLTCQNANLNFPVILTSDCGNATSSSTLLPSGTTAISLTKTTATTSVAVGSTILYTLTYTNNGSRQYDTVTLNDTVPANTVYSGNNGWVCTPNNNAGSVCTVTLAANGQAVPFQVTLSSNLTCDITSVTNTATAQGYCAGPPVSFQTNVVTSTVPVTVTGNPDFYVTKVATDGNGNAISGVQTGGQVTYVITYGNRGQRIASAVITEAAVGTPFNFVGPSTWSAPNANGQRTFAVSNVYPGQTGTVNFVVQAAGSLATCANVSVPNTVTIAASQPCVETNLADNTATAQASVSGSVDLYIYFVATTTYTIPTSTTANLQFCFGNNGNSGTTNASMTVTLPAGITAASTGNTGFVVNGQTVSYFIGTVAANQAVQCRTLIVNLPASLNCTDASYNQTASITSDCTETNTTNNVTPYSLSVTATFDLYIGLSQPANTTLTQASNQVTYCVTYGNNGVKAVTPVILYITAANSTSFVASASDSRWVSAGGQSYTLNLGSVSGNFASNSCIAFAVAVNLPIPTGLTSVTTTAYISNNGICGNETTLVNNNASVVTPIVGNPDLFVLKTNNGASFFGPGALSSASGSAFTGNVVRFTISYGNNGDADAVNATVSETVPPTTVYDSANSNSAWSCTDGAVAGTVCTANVGRVPIAANRAQGVVFGTLNFAVRATTYAGALATPALRCPTNPTTNFVSIAVSTPQVDLNQANNQANATTPFLGLPNLYIRKTVANPTLTRVSGNVIQYNISYGNNGVKEAVNTVIVDTIPEYTIFNAAGSSSGFVCSNGGVAGSNCSFSAGNIASGQTGSLSFAVTLQPGFPSTAFSTTNFVEISNSCEGGNETTLVDNVASVTVNITGYFDLVLQKHGYCESILYTMTYENVGTIGAQDVFLLTYIPQDSTFDANNSAPGWICNANTPGAACRYPVTAVDPRFPGVLDFLAPGAGGSVNFAITPYASSMSSTFTLDSSVDANFAGEDLDPTPDNNHVSTTVGFSGCAACDSCCPAVDQCCPDYTDVNFNFGGVLDGINTCQ